MTTKNAYSDSWDWGSYGDDALYKFLESNCITWNNDENTRQIELRGVRRRIYILKDISHYDKKSYRDLTPRQIEKHYLYYNQIKNAVEKEAQWYEKCSTLFSSLKDTKRFRNKTETEIRTDLINSDDTRQNQKWIITFRIIDRGIRPRNQIVDEFEISEYYAEQKIGDNQE